MSLASREETVLAYLRANDGAVERPRMVADALGCTVAAAVYALQSLERQGCVERLSPYLGGSFTSLWRLRVTP